MRVLSLAAEPPFPPNHGVRLRTWHLATRLARNHDVTMLTWTRGDADDNALHMLRGAVTDVIALPRGHARNDAFARAARLARFVAGGLPAYVKAMLEERTGRDDSLHEAIVRLHRDRSFDLVVAEEEAMAWLPVHDLGVPVVVHRLNVFSRVLDDVRRGDRRGTLIGLFDRGAWRGFDERTSARAALQVATTPESAADLTAICPSVPVAVVTNGVEMLPPADHDGHGGDVAFVGWMGYPPNEEAADWFVRRVWPTVRSAHPTSTLRIIGREPSARVRALAGDGVVVTGEVASIPEACSGVTVGVAPLHAGMGIKNKTLELMSMGIPVVALPRGSEGIAANDDDGLLAVTDAASMAGAVGALLGDRTRACTLGVAARSFVVAHHSWDVIAASYESVLTNIVDDVRVRDAR